MVTHQIRFRSLKTSALTFAVALMIIGISILAIVRAPPPPSTVPIPINQYGLVSVYSNEVTQSTLGTVKVQVVSNGYGAFYIVKLFVFMNLAQQYDLTLSTLSLDGFYTISLSQYYSPQSPKVVVVPAGYTMGDVVGSLPSYLNSLLVKDPTGNPSILLNGGAGNGLLVQLTFSSPSSGGTIGAEAIVMAPANNTITVSLS